MSKNRPTSPHATIYRWQITNTLSILHRLTGLALVVGTGLLAIWLWSAAYSPHAVYYDVRDILKSLPGKLIMFGWTLAFFYHFGNGIRHLFWDIGRGFEIANVTRSGVAVLVFTVAMTGLVWGLVLGVVK